MELSGVYHVLKIIIMSIFWILCLSANLSVYQVCISCVSDLCVSGNEKLEKLKLYQQLLGYNN